MKKTIAMMLVVILCMGLWACGPQEPEKTLPDRAGDEVRSQILFYVSISYEIAYRWRAQVHTYTHTHTHTHTHAAFLQKFFYLGVTTSWVGLLMPPSQNQTHKLCNQVRFRPNCLENPTK